jgi:hypothetical protein
MANPSGLTAFPETEYVEIYNASDDAISLKNWKFVYDGKAIALPDVVLPAGAYAVLFREGRDIQVFSPGIAIPVATFPSSLANTGKTLQLVNTVGTTIDEVTYAAAKAALAWERATDEAGNPVWYLSNDANGGTPGVTNSPIELPAPPEPEPDFSRFGDLLITEIMANPSGLTAFPETEYVEIYNASGDAISLKGWAFVYDGKATAFPEVTLPAGCYAVIYREGREVYVDSSGMAIPIAAFPANLANTGKSLQIVNTEGVVIDSVTYAAATPARAWERATDADGQTVWYLSNDANGGTPGTANSPVKPAEPPTPPEPEPAPDISRPGDVLITEIMANPSGLTAFPETEYVEIFNASEDSISLSGWAFVYDDKATALPAITLPAGSYAVMYREGREAYVDSSGIAMPITAFPANLANTGKTVKLINTIGLTIDSVSYPEATPARSYERNPEGDDWYLSNDARGGTPGTINSSSLRPSYPDDFVVEEAVKINEKGIVFNELMPEPFEGGSEYIELYNRSERPLLLTDLVLAIRRADGTTGTHYSLSSIMDIFDPGSYIVLTSSRNGVLDFYSTPAPQNVYELKMPLMNNEGSTFVLFSVTDGTIIDEVAYSAKWHDKAIKKAKGVALERIHPDEETQNAMNWTSAVSTVGYGTPGYQNSQYMAVAESSIAMETPQYLPGFNEYVIAYHTDRAGYHCRIEIYTAEGRKMATVVNNQLTAQEGEIRWNGDGLDGNRLRPGLYVFYAELYHLEGQQKTIKKVFLIKPE